MKHNVISSHKVIGTIISIVVFIILFKYFAIQIGDTKDNATLAPAWLALTTTIFGPISGAVTAFVGHMTTDLLTNSGTGTVWWTWTIADGLFGLFIGLITRRLAIFMGKLTTRKLILFNIWQFLANFVVWVIIAPLGDYWVYNLPLAAAVKEGLLIMAVNTIMIAIVGSLLLRVYQHYFID